MAPLAVSVQPTLKPERLPLRDLQWKLQDFLSPEVLILACPWWQPQP